MTNGADPLAEYYVATPRQASGLSGRAGIHVRVDAILNELRIPAEVDKDGDWKLTTDVGPFLLIVEKERSDLVAVQTIQSMDKKVAKSSDEMYVLLALNFEARGLARFGTVKDGGQDLLVLTARLAPDTISRETVEGMVGDCFRLSRRVDELLGNEPPPAEPAAEPPPPEQAPVEAPAAETVFAQPVPQAPPEPEPTPAAEPTAPAEPEPSYPPPVVAEPDPAPPAEPEPSYPPPVVAEPEPAPVQPEPSYPPPTEPEPSYPPPTVAEPVQSYQPPQPPVALPEANWYPDPYYQARLRYWDGQSWTQHVAN